MRRLARSFSSQLLPPQYPPPQPAPGPLVGGALNSARVATEERSNSLARRQVKGILGHLRPIGTTERSIKGL